MHVTMASPCETQFFYDEDAPKHTISGLYSGNVRMMFLFIGSGDGIFSAALEFFIVTIPCVIFRLDLSAGVDKMVPKLATLQVRG